MQLTRIINYIKLVVKRGNYSTYKAFCQNKYVNKEFIFDASSRLPMFPSYNRLLGDVSSYGHLFNNLKYSSGVKVKNIVHIQYGEKTSFPISNTQYDSSDYLYVIHDARPNVNTTMELTNNDAEKHMLSDISSIKDKTLVGRLINRPMEELRVNTKHVFPMIHCTYSRDLYPTEYVSTSIVEHYDGNAYLCYGTSRAIALDDGIINSKFKTQIEYATMEIAQLFPSLEYFNVIYDSSYDCKTKEYKLEIFLIDTGESLYLRNTISLPTAAKLEKFNVKLGYREYMSRCIYAFLARRRSMIGFMYKNWLMRCVSDYLEGKTTLLTTHNFHSKGFFSYRKEQYDMENKELLLSDYDYYWIRPINSGCWRVFWDKLAQYYFFNSIGVSMPKHYLHIVKYRNITNYYDLGNNYSSYHDENALRYYLSREKKLVCKPIIGSRGQGINFLEYVDENTCRCNGKIVKYDEINDFFENDYIVMQYIEQNSFLNAIYPNVVSTIRMTIINDDGPKLVDAYLRIGTSFSGNTDNISNGGICAKIDLDSGVLTNAELLVNHKFSPIGEHPDTNVRITGTIPHWDKCKSEAIMIANTLNYLQYIGLDMAITNSGCTLLEMNTHPDLHKYCDCDERLKKFLLDKVSRKKSFFDK